MNTVEFPGLWGLKFTVSRTAFEAFGLSVYWYGIIIAVGFMTAVLLAMRDSNKFGIESEHVIDLVLIAAPVAVICARIYYVIFKLNEYDSFVDLLNIRKGGLAIYGGILGGIAAAYFFAKRKKIGVLKLFDFGVPYLVLAQGIGRWGNFTNQEAFGTNTTLPWGMTSESVRNELLRLQASGMNVDPSIPVHPTFLYEFLWNIGVFFFLIWFRKRKKIEGEVFFLYMALYGLGRFWIEGLRTDSLMLGSFRISQILAAVFAVVFAAVIFIRRTRVLGENTNEEVIVGQSNYADVLNQIKDEENNVEK
ncbi:MAG: prolipoprotein diacylglyceryl transferase [Clostridia bacterium]|nr:prolipoprotein diacylglyceryl transferase [Clostridia bacterium]